MYQHFVLKNLNKMWPFKEPLNPYVIGNAVGNSSVFVGREDVLQAVRNVLQHQHQGAIVLYGQRRIGKTSILKELEAKLAQAGYLPIFFDLQDKGKFPLEQVNQELANKISDKLNSQSTTLENILFHWQSSKKLVILFDEFEAFAGNEFEERQASEAFFPYWRDILAKVDKAKLNFVFTLGRKVEDLNQKAMSLLKAIPSTKVSLLCEEETRQLIRLSDSENNKTLKWDEEAIKTVRTQTGGHPFITQILCYCIWNQFCEIKPHSKPKVRVTDVKANLTKALETGENAFQWLWDGLPATEKLVTSILASTGNKPITAQALEQLLKDNGLRIKKEEQQKATDILKDWDVIEEHVVGKKFRFRVELFRHWIAKNRQLQKVQLELDSHDIMAHNFYEASRNLWATGQLEAAIDNLKKALKLNPNHISANALLTETYLDTQNWKKAWKTAKSFSLMRPKFARPLLSQALEKLIAGQNEDTQLHYYEETLKIDPEHNSIKQQWQKIWQQRGENAYLIGNMEKALEAFQKIGSIEKVIEIKNQLAQEINQTQRIIEAFLIELVQETTTLDGIFIYESQGEKIYLGTKNGIDTIQKSIIANSLFGSKENQKNKISILGLREIVERIKDEQNDREFECAFFQFATSILSIYLIPNAKIYDDCGNKNEEVFMMVGIISANNAIGIFIKESKKAVTRIKEKLPIDIKSNKIG